MEAWFLSIAKDIRKIEKGLDYKKWDYIINVFQ